MKLPTLYSRTSTGAVQQWTIEVEGDKYRSIHGQVDGKKVTNEWTIAIPTNVGRSNERLGEAQAEFEAKAQWKKRIETGYHESIKDIDKPTMIDCMLAKKYEDFDIDWTTPIYTQPKLDGIRCLTTAETMFSRGGKIFTSCPHILKALKDFFAEHPDAILDGELYCDKLANDFNKITSLVKKTKPNEKDLEESARTIQYHVYDIIEPSKTFSQRTAWLESNLTTKDPAIRLVMTVKVGSEEELDRLYEGFLAAGYEGQMIRLDGVYEQKRSKFLLKRKTFQDAEYKILEICEGTGNRTGMAGWAVLENRDGSTFKSNIKGSHDFLTELWKNREEAKGEMGTCQFFNLTPDGVPRFPYVTSIRNYE